MGLCLVAPDGRVVRANAEWLRSTGYAAEQVIGKDIIELFPSTREMAGAMYSRARAGYEVAVPLHAARIGERETWWEGSIAPVPMEGGTGLLITARPVGPLDQRGGHASAPADADANLLARVREIADHAPAAFFAKDRDGRYVFGNRWTADLLGVEPGDLTGRTVSHLLPPAIDERTRAYDRRVAAGEEVVTEDAIPTPHGDRTIMVVRFPFPLPSGKVIAFGIGVDITDRKRAEAERERLLRDLHHRAAELEATLASMADGAIVYGRGGEILRMNRAAEEILGFTRRELEGAGSLEARAILANVRTPDGAPFPVEATPIRSALRGETRRGVQMVVHKRTGEARWVSASAAPIRGPDGETHGAVATFSDVTDRRRAEEEVRAAFESAERERRRLAAVLEALPAGVAISDAAGKVTDFNAAIVRIWGGPPVPQSTAEYEAWRGRWADTGEPLAPEDWAMARALTTGEVVPGDVVEIERFDGGRATIINAAAPIRGGDGRIVGGVVAEVDITEQRRAEQALREADARLRAANEQLREADRRKDEFLGMLSHELRNPLAPIRNSVYVLEHAAPDGEQAARARAVIQRQTEHLTRLVDDLLDVTRIARGKADLRRTRLDLREVVLRAADDFRLLLEDRGIALRTVLPDVKVWADADATRVAQVVGNLLHNAAKFTRRGDEVTLSLTAAGGEAELRVRDTGEGIAPALLPSVFDAFVQGERTLARTDGGLGLGLALVKGIAELHGGTVHAESAGKGRGAEFVVRLPLVAPAAQQESPRPGLRGGSGGRRVLVVDDNVDAAESLAEIATMMGHVVEVAFDGPSAIAKARANPPDVVLCDIGLPGMSGYDVARALRASGHGMQLVAVSGYAQPEDVKRAVEAGFDGHVAKPVDPADIERLLA